MVEFRTKTTTGPKEKISVWRYRCQHIDHGGRTLWFKNGDLHCRRYPSHTVLLLEHVYYPRKKKE